MSIDISIDGIILDIKKHCNNIDNFNKDLLQNLDQKSKDFLESIVKFDILNPLNGINKINDVEQKNNKHRTPTPRVYNPYNE